MPAAQAARPPAELALVRVKAPRRSHAERTTETRGKLLDAAIACLHERGYSDTTTTAVVEAAGLSRGAMLHHFGTKLDMIRAVVEHVFALHAEVYRERLEAFDTPRARFIAVMDIAWDVFQRPSYMALLEIWISTRNDPELRAVFRNLEDESGARAEAGITALAREAGVKDAERLRSFQLLVTNAFGGMAIDMAIHGDRDRFKGSVDELRRIAASLLEEAPRVRRRTSPPSP